VVSGQRQRCLESRVGRRLPELRGAGRHPADRRLERRRTTEVGAIGGHRFLDNGNGVWDDPTISLTPDTVYANFGAPDDIPVTGDWDGKGKTEVGTWRRGTWFLDNGNGRWDAGVDTVYQNFGASDDIPVTGNWH
jgi:hypothetical protein